MYYYQPNAGMGLNPYQTQVSGLKGRPVSSLEEVRAAQVDFDGSLFIFPDIANKRIYTKQINLNGTASLNVYDLGSIPSTPPVADYVTREEFLEAIKQLKEPAKESVKPAPASKNFNF